MIELGEVSASAATAQAAPTPMSLPSFRKVALTVLGLLCLLGVTGSARPEPSTVRRLWSTPIGDGVASVVSSDTVYLHQMVADSAWLTALDLSTGATRWTRKTGDTVGYVQVMPVGGLLLLPVQPDRTGNTTIAIDARTGDEVWRVPGTAQTVWGDTALFTVNDGSEIVGIRMIRLADHSTVWSRDTPGVQSQAVAFDGDRPTKIVTVRRGVVKIYRYADGTLLTTATVPWPVTIEQDGPYTNVFATRDHLVVDRTDKKGSAAEVYRLDTVTPRWHVSSVGGSVSACAAAICVAGADGIVAHDPDTGRALWRVADTTGVSDVGNGRLMLDNGSEAGRRVLVDTAGRQIGDAVDGTWVWPWRQDGSLLLLHPTTSPAGRTAISRWSLTTGRLDLLGSIDELVNRCESVPHYLTCLDGGQLTVTAVG